jgi:hypothetical protein
MRIRNFFFALWLAAVFTPECGAAAAFTFPLPAGLEDRVEFWKQVFSRYTINEVIFFDPGDPAMR